MVQDMVKILNLGQRFAPRYAAMRLAAAARKQSGGPAATGSTNIVVDEEEDDNKDTDDDLAAAAVDQEAGTSTGSRILSLARDGGRPLSAAVDGGSASEGNNAAGEEGEASEGDNRRRLQQPSVSALRGSADKVGPGPSSAPVAQDIALAQRIRKRLRDQMSPTTDAAVWLKVRQELAQRGSFEPLMSMFPGVVQKRKSEPSVSEGNEGRGVPWSDRDREMRSLVGHLSRAENRSPR